MKLLSKFSVTELRRIVGIKTQIETLQGRLETLIGEDGNTGAGHVPVAATPIKRRMSPGHRRKLIKVLARARKIRWAKARAAAVPATKRRRMSATARAAISAAAKARWAKFRAAKAA